MDSELLLKVDAALALLQRVAIEHRPAAFASSLGAEDMVLTDMIARHRFGIDIFTLETGRLHGDTLQLVETIERRYGRKVELVKPDPAAVGEYVARHGRDAFYTGVELRKRCCEIRKVEPLRRALAGRKAWITGLRRSQSAARAEVAVKEFDLGHGMAKFNPLAEWSEEEVWSYIRFFEVPYNALHDQGYRSIGCAPCTRPVAAGEDARAGRWWWEIKAATECGIHFSPDGKLVRENVPT
ncbi:MAG TPA: phosphoadenylyl-sulfate reductase [Burkholderiales bacterium]